MSYDVAEWPLDAARSVFTVTLTFATGERFHGTHHASYEGATELVLRAVEEAGGPAALKARWGKQ